MKVEGIVLRAVPYQESQHIITLFTPQGLLSVFVKGSERSRQFSHSLVTPLTRAEFVLIERPPSTLLRIQDAKTLDQHLLLRADYLALETGCEIAKALLSTQNENKGATLLYALVAQLLHRLNASNALAVGTTFFLKLLKYEGLSTYHETCSICHQPLLAAHLLEHGAYCQAHAPHESLPFSEEERAILLMLSATQKWKEIAAMEVSETLYRKVKKLFESLTR
ncbi:MAG: DNA repair protein RecO [Verrucomicrobia bacterium]|nr:DNA repair protein RecO [Verrucomicrobiota bacterium]